MLAADLGFESHYVLFDHVVPKIEERVRSMVLGSNEAATRVGPGAVEGWTEASGDVRVRPRWGQARTFWDWRSGRPPTDEKVERRPHPDDKASAPPTRRPNRQL
jgi:hypothetical protein